MIFCFQFSAEKQVNIDLYKSSSAGLSDFPACWCSLDITTSSRITRYTVEVRTTLTIQALGNTISLHGFWSSSAYNVLSLQEQRRSVFGITISVCFSWMLKGRLRHQNWILWPLGSFSLKMIHINPLTAILIQYCYFIRKILKIITRIMT